MGNIKINIEDISIYLPKKTVSNSQLDKIFNQKENTFFEKTGIKKRKISSVNETPELMATKAALKLLKKKKTKTSITHIISASNTPSIMFPSIAHYVLSGIYKYLKTNPFCIPLNCGCSGFVDALILSNKIISNNKKSKILIVTSDAYSKHISSDDKSILPVFSDGASATIISHNPKGWSVEKEFSETIPFTQENLIFKEINGKNIITMRGPELINFAINSVLPKISQMIKDEKKIILFSHQASKIVLNLIVKSAFKINKNVEIPLFYRNVGNLVSTSIPVLINKNIKLFRRSKKILIAGFGVGLTHSYIKFKK